MPSLFRCNVRRTKPACPCRYAFRQGREGRQKKIGTRGMTTRGIINHTERELDNQTTNITANQTAYLACCKRETARRTVLRTGWRQHGYSPRHTEEHSLRVPPPSISHSECRSKWGREAGPLASCTRPDVRIEHVFDARLSSSCVEVRDLTIHTLQYESSTDAVKKNCLFVLTNKNAQTPSQRQNAYFRARCDVYLR